MFRGCRSLTCRAAVRGSSSLTFRAAATLLLLFLPLVQIARKLRHLHRMNEDVARIEQLMDLPRSDTLELRSLEDVIEIELGTNEDSRHENNDLASSNATTDRIRVFYNVYANSTDEAVMNRAKNIVKEQMALLLPRHEVFVRSIGSQFAIENATLLRHNEKGNEPETLKLLWDYCQDPDNENQKVVYIHNKGSFTPTKENDSLRQWLTRAALSEECSNMPFSCNVCSYRFSPLPHPHNSGNMWAARCDYIRRLINPLMIERKMEQLYKPKQKNNALIGTGRYASEHWVHSHPTIKPCDVSTSGFLWGYENIPVSDDFKLEAAPRYDWETFLHVPWLKTSKPDFTKRKHRLLEYKFLYNETPPASWFGWKFYNDITPTGTGCTCVDCNEDKVCGGLWRGNRYVGMPSDEEAIRTKIHIVVSHCKQSLDWMPRYLEGFTNIASVHVISKCGQEAEINNATTIVLPNVGRNDHAFAYYISHILLDLVTDKTENSVVVFLKDTMTEKIFQQRFFRRADLKYLVRLASSSNGFACGLNISTTTNFHSAYHDVATLRNFELKDYKKGVQDYNNTGAGADVPFQSQYNTFGNFFRSLNASSIPDLVQVCYGGMFASSTENIFKQDMSVWRTLEKSLVRGDNIQEGHYAERSWGALLASPLKPFQIKALRKHSTEVRKGPLHGALERKYQAKKRNGVKKKSLIKSVQVQNPT